MVEEVVEKKKKTNSMLASFQVTIHDTYKH